VNGSTSNPSDAPTFGRIQKCRRFPRARHRGGDTSPDAWRGLKDGEVFLLLAERRGGGDGRVYRIAFVVSDGRLGQCSGSVAVGVPRNQSKQAAPVDSGQAFDSFSASGKLKSDGKK
jgi:hypothetical protein